MTTKKDLSERDICTKFITPAIVHSGWDIQVQVREQVYITKGRVIVRGRMASRAKGKFADYILYHKPNIPVAIVEAKDNNHSVGDGMQQALEYSETLNIPFVFLSWHTVQVESVSPVLCKARGRFDGLFFSPEQRKASGVQGAAMSPLVAGMDAAKS